MLDSVSTNRISVSKVAVGVRLLLTALKAVCPPDKPTPLFVEKAFGYLTAMLYFCIRVIIRR